jgi:hypothetical protein
VLAGAGAARRSRGRPLRPPSSSRQQTLAAKAVAAQAQLDTAPAQFQSRQGRARGSAPADHGRADVGARGRHRGRRASRSPAALARHTGASETKLARRKLVSPVTRRGAAGLLPAGREWCRRAGRCCRSCRRVI